MKHLRFVVLRELDHFRGLFILLTGLVGLSVLVHVLVSTLIPGRSLADFLEALKGYVVPGVFGVLCALMGYADSPEHGSHEFRTRPVRLKTLYVGKLILIAVTAACLVLVQSVMNLVAGYSMNVWILWWPLFLAGLIFFFLAAILRPTVLSALQLLVVIGLPWILGDWLGDILRSQVEVEIFSLGYLTMIFVAAPYAMVVFCGKVSLGARLFWFLFLPYAALAVGVGVWLVPLGRQTLSSDAVEKVLSKRLNPELRLTEYRDERVHLIVSEPKTEESVLQRVRFVNRVVKLESSDGVVRRLPQNQWWGWSYNQSEEYDILRALGVTPPLTKKQLEMQLRYDPDESYSLSGRTGFKIPSEFRGKKIKFSTEGAAHYWETESLGSLPIRKGAKCSNEDLSVEIVGLAKGGSLVKLRVQSGGEGGIRLGAFQKNVKEPYRTYGRTMWTTSHKVLRGMSMIDIFEVRIHSDQIEESNEPGFLHLYTVVYRGSTPFQSKPYLLDLSQEKDPSRLLRANYPILPSIIPIESK